MSRLTPAHTLRVGQHILVADEDAQPLVRILALERDSTHRDAPVHALVALAPFEDKTLRVQFAPLERVRLATTKRLRARILHTAPGATPHATPIFVSAAAPYSMLKTQVWAEHPLHDQILAAATLPATVADLDVVVAHTRPPLALPGDRTRTAFVAYAPLDATLDVRPHTPAAPLWAP